MQWIDEQIFAWRVRRTELLRGLPRLSEQKMAEHLIIWTGLSRAANKTLVLSLIATAMDLFEKQREMERLAALESKPEPTGICFPCGGTGKLSANDKHGQPVWSARCHYCGGSGKQTVISSGLSMPRAATVSAPGADAPTEDEVERVARAIYLHFYDLDEWPPKTEPDFGKGADDFRAAARAAAAAMTRRAEDGGWLPIESAPKDDTLFLAATAEGRMMIWRGKLLADSMLPTTPHHLHFPATHWRPLPPPPSGSKDTDR